MKKLLLIPIFILLANCSYKPLINPETSRDKFDGNNIAGNYWKDLHACRYIHKENTHIFLRKLGISDQRLFVQKCMNEYGYTTLR